jgi:tRNA-splicing ligase RtcB
VDLSRFIKQSDYCWEIPPQGNMRVPAVIYADEALIRDMDEKVYYQATNVAALPGIVKASYAMPDAHWGYGFPIGGVAAFDADEGGVVSAGGVGYDISCGVRCLHTNLKTDEVRIVQKDLADMLYYKIPAGVGSTGAIRLNESEMDRMLAGGAQWARKHGWGSERDARRTAGFRIGQSQEAPTRRDGHARQRESLFGSAARCGNLRPRRRNRFCLE